MKKQCLRLNDSRSSPKWDGIFVNLQKRVAMCFVGKVAGISWARILLKLTGNPNAVKLANSHRCVVGKNAHKYLHRMDKTSAHQRVRYMMGNYKIMFVRDPLERLISAYRDKVLTPCKGTSIEKLRYRIKKIFRSNTSSRFLLFCNLQFHFVITV